MKPTLHPWIVALLVACTASVAPSQTTWTNNGTFSGYWTNGALWSGPVAGYPNGTDSIAVFNGAGIAGYRGVTNNVSITNGSIIFNTPVINTGFNLWTNTGTARLYLDVLTGSALISNSTNTGSGLNQVIMPITMLDALVVSNNGTLNFSGDIDNGGYAVTFKGTGTTTLGRPMTGAGQVELQSGVLNLQHTNAVGPAGGPAMIASGGAISWGLGAAGLIPKALVISNSVALVPQGSGSASFGWQGGISGPGQLVISNQAAPTSGLTLWSNSYSGGTLLSNTIASINSSFAFGSGTVTIREGTRLNNYQTTAFVNQVVLQGNPTFSNGGMTWTNSVWDMDGGSRTLFIDHNNAYILTLAGLTNGANLGLVRKQLFTDTFVFYGPVSHTGFTFADGVTLQLGATTANSAELVNSTNVVLNNGTFLLDDRGGAASRVRADAGFILTNGALQIIGPGTAGQLFTQQVGAVSLNFGANTLQVTNRGTFLADTLSRATGTTLNILGTNLPTVYVANAPAGATNGIVPYAVVNYGANGFAGWSNGALVVYAGYTNVVADDPTANVKLAGAAIPTMTSSRTINSLYISNSGVNLNLGGNILTIASGGLLFGPDPTPLITNGVVNFGSAEGVLYNNTAVRIYAALDGQAGITKSGAQSLFLYGTNTYSGDTRVNQGSLILQGGAISNAGNLVLVQGAAFQLINAFADVNSLQSVSNWLGTLATVTLSSGSLVTRSNSSVYGGTMGQSLTLPTTWTLLGGSNYTTVALGTNATLRVSGAGTKLVLPVSVSGGSNVVSVESGAALTTAGTAINILGSNNLLRLDGTTTTGTFDQLGLGGAGNAGARILVTNGATMTGARLYVGSPQNDFATAATNAEIVVSSSTLNLNGGASALFVHVGGATNASGNRLSLRQGSTSQMIGGNAASYLALGRGAFASSNLLEVADGSSLRFSGGGSAMTGLFVGNTNAGGTGNAFVLRGGSLFELGAATGGTNLVLVSGAGNVVSNVGSIFQFAGSAATIGAWVQADNSGSIVFTNATLSWRNRADGYVTPVIAGSTLTNITWQGDNGFMLNGASNATGLAEYTFDSVANTGTATNFQRLLLTGTNSLWRSARLNIAAGGELIVTNAAGTARIQGIVTNAGTITVLNSSLAFASNTVISGGLISDPSTITFQSNAIVTASGYINATNDTYVFWRDFFNQSTNTALFRMNQATALFTNGAGVATHTLSLSNSAAIDLGHFTNFGMVAGNLSIGTLSIAPGDRLTLTGNKDSKTNALYVGWLDIQGLTLGSTNSYLAVSNTLVSSLNLPNINLYYDVYDTRNDWLTRWLPPVDGAGYDLWGGGLLLPIPEPSTWAAMGAGLALLAFVRRRTAV